jgi:hypothetical protein
LARVHARTQAEADAACMRLHGAFKLGQEPPELPPLITETID